jgi:hypothetical protein
LQKFPDTTGASVAMLGQRFLGRWYSFRAMMAPPTPTASSASEAGSGTGKTV